MRIEDILHSDPLFRGKDNLFFEPLNGGASNETYLVSLDGTKYVLRINFQQNEYLSLSRSSEMLAQQKAASLG